MYKRKDLLLMKPEELAKVLMDYSKDKKGEIADLTNVASIQIKVLNDRNNEKTDKLFELDSKMEEIRESICDNYCKYPGECFDEDDLTDKCNECPLNKLKVE